jgi:hypothetical protein
MGLLRLPSIFPIRRLGATLMFRRCRWNSDKGEASERYVKVILFAEDIAAVNKTKQGEHEVSCNDKAS